MVRQEQSLHCKDGVYVGVGQFKTLNLGLMEVELIGPSLHWDYPPWEMGGHSSPAPHPWKGAGLAAAASNGKGQVSQSQSSTRMAQD